MFNFTNVTWGNFSDSKTFVSRGRLRGYKCARPNGSKTGRNSEIGGSIFFRPRHRGAKLLKQKKILANFPLPWAMSDLGWGHFGRTRAESAEMTAAPVDRLTCNGFWRVGRHIDRAAFPNWKNYLSAEIGPKRPKREKTGKRLKMESFFEISTDMTIKKCPFLNLPHVKGRRAHLLGRFNLPAR